jgi:polynucleotide 5'-hydroxyl-kinase GRC3/NOL9
LIALKPGERIFFSGAVLLCPLKQRVSSFGTVFSPTTSKDNSLKFWPIYSPKSNSLLCIEHCSADIEDTRIVQFPGGGDDAYGVYSTLIDLAASLSPLFLTDDDTSIFAIKSISWSGISLIEDCAPIYRGMLLDDSEENSFNTKSLRDVELFCPILEQAPTLPLLHIQESWKEAATRVNKFASPIIFVVGGRNVGKSTCSKYLVNSLLNSHASVGYLDCDISVPEFSPYGVASVKLVKNPLLGT